MMKRKWHEKKQIDLIKEDYLKRIGIRGDFDYDDLPPSWQDAVDSMADCIREAVDKAIIKSLYDE